METKIKPSILALACIALISCGGGGGGSSSPENAGSPPANGDGNGDNSGDSGNDAGDDGDSDQPVDPVNAEFNISTAKTLITQLISDETGQAVLSNSNTSSGPELQYLTAGSKSNLIAMGSDGEVFPAIDSDLPISVSFTVTNPQKTHVYVALDQSDWSVNYQEFIAKNNCALFAVSLADNSYECVVEGIMVENYSNGFFSQYHAVGRKPLQFDALGNVYFIGNTFTREGSMICHSDTDCEVVDYTSIYVDGSVRSLYKVNQADKVAENLNLDNETIDRFVVVDSGAVFYQSHNTISGNIDLFMRNPQGSRVNVAPDNYSYDTYLSVDDNNTVIYCPISNDNEKIEIMRSFLDGVERSSLSLQPLLENYAGNDNNGWRYDGLLRLIQDEAAGKLYGIFRLQRYRDNEWEYGLSIHQILPYQGPPQLIIDEGDGYLWDHVNGTTSVLVADDTIIYKSVKDLNFGGINYGQSDLIRIKKENGDMVSILEPFDSDDARYTLFNWRRDNQKLVFSAVEQSDNMVVFGTVDLDKLKAGDEDFLEIENMLSATGAAAKVTDIEVIREDGDEPVSDDGLPAQLVAVNMNIENLTSISLEFDKKMDAESVENAITLNSDDIAEGMNGVIPYMPVWLGNRVNFIVDRNGFGDSAEATPLSANQTYSLAFADGVVDSFGNPLDYVNLPDNTSFRTRPSQGWYLGENRLDSPLVAEGDSIFRYVYGSEYQYRGYGLVTDISSDRFRLEFSVRIHGDSGFQLDVFRNNYTMFYLYMREEIGLYSYISNRWTSIDAPEETDGLNYNWTRYRIEFYDSTLHVYYKSDQGEFKEIIEFNQPMQYADDYYDTTITLQTLDRIDFSDIEITSLDEEGQPVGEPGDLYSAKAADFENGDMLPFMLIQ